MLWYHDFKYSTKKANFEWCVESYFFSSDSDELSIQLLKILSLPWRGGNQKLNSDSKLHCIKKPNPPNTKPKKNPTVSI